MKPSLFNTFDPVSSKAYKQKINVDLKGADYNDTLVWQALEGIKVRPFYHQDEMKNSVAIPGHPEKWNIGQSIFIDDEGIANAIAQDAVNRGAEAIYFMAKKPFDYKQLCKGFDFGNFIGYIHCTFNDPSFFNELTSYFDNSNANIQLLWDPINQLVTDGNWFENQVKDLESLKSLSTTKKTTITIDASVYQNAGANMVQQLTYALSHTNEYLNALENLENSTIVFKISVGSNYFFEIAKIRALRLLFAALANEYQITSECHIIAVPSKRNKTIYDYNVNMLRTTTEVMSAVLGGADTVINLPYDALYHKSNEFGERISRNQLLILKEESYFDVVSNAVDGSYYIESLTQELADKSLAIFKDIEASGGFLKQLKEGTIQRKIKESAAKEQQLFDNGELILLGTNKHPNTADKMKDNLDLYPFVKTNPRKTHVQPIIPRRLADTIEQERLRDEA